MENNQNNKKNKIEKYKKELIESYEKIDELETKLVNEENKYNDLFSKNKILQQDINDKNSLVYETEEKLLQVKTHYENEIKHFEKIVDDLKIKINDNKVVLVQKSDLILQLENKIITLQSDFKKAEIQLSFKSTKQKKDLLVPLLESENDDEKIILKNQIQKHLEKIKELEQDNIKLENTINILNENQKNKVQNEINLQDEIYILEKENKLENIKKELKNMYDEKIILEKQLFELKSMVQILKEDNFEGIYSSKKKFCCFM